MEEKQENHCLRERTRAYGAEQNGLLASLNSVAKLPYEYALDGISNTQTINPGCTGTCQKRNRTKNLVQVMDGYFDQGAHHLNVNVFGREKLERCYGTSGKGRICKLYDPCIRLCREIY